MMEMKPAAALSGQPDPIQGYFQLLDQRPDLFVQSGSVPLVLEEDKIRAYAAETGKPMGLVFDNRPFFLVLADLCAGNSGVYRYARVVYPQAGSNGSVALPYRNGKFGLLKLFRHAPRCVCWEVPRGFAQKGLTPEENIRKELAEEIGAAVKEVRLLGAVQADTGLSSGCAQVFLAEVEEASAQTGHEGILDFVWMTPEELKHCIASGQIQDGFTLSALTLCFCQNAIKL